MSFWRRIGPGPLIAAAFIGPGTVTLCTLAGVGYGTSLLWALVFAIIATGVLQEMAARVGLVSRNGLSELISSQFQNPIIKVIALVLVISAVVIGNASYEAGNISGAVIGMEGVFGDWKISGINIWSVLIGALAFLLLMIGSYKTLERILVGLVIFLSSAFIITAIMTRPNITEIIKGIFIPAAPEGSWLTIIGLIGTTIVPYNLFLHSNLVKEKWSDTSDIQPARTDTWIAVILGGLVSMAIVICAAAIKGSDIKNTADLSLALEPLFGSLSKYFVALGLFAAGITSAMTAPLAAAYVVKGCLGWDVGLKDSKFRMVWVTILLIGIIFSTIGFSPIAVIKFAQVANGVLLPIIAIFLLWIANQKGVLGEFTNSTVQNILGVAIIGITIAIGTKGVLAGVEWFLN